MKRQTTHPERARRRAAAAERQAKRDARTPEEQAAIILTRPGSSARETARLAKGSK